MKKTNIHRDIALIAKEIGLEEDLMKPTGEGMKERFKILEKDINGVGRKVNLLEDKIKKIEEKKFSFPPPKEQEEKIEKINDKQTFDSILTYGRRAWYVARPLLYALGIAMLYLLGKALGIDIPLIQ